MHINAIYAPALEAALTHTQGQTLEASAWPLSRGVQRVVLQLGQSLC